MMSGLDDNKQAGLRQRFDDLAPDRGFWKNKNRYYYREQDRFLKFLIPEGASVLELGCGTGESLNAVKPGYGVGVDFSAGMLDIARKQFPHLHFRQENIEQLQFRGETFDFIILVDVIGHLLDVEEAFNRLRPFCKATTRVIISYYNFFWEPVLKAAEKLGLKMPEGIQNWLSPEDISGLLSLADLEVVKSEYRFLMPARIPLVSNLVNRHLASLPLVRNLCLCRYFVARPLKLRERNHYAVTILIPCRNEKDNIEPAVRRIPGFGQSQEIIFVEGHSSDGTAAEIRRVSEQYPQKNISLLFQDGQGKGDAVRKGFDAAAGDVLMILDADLTVPPEDLPRFYKALVNDHGEFINGCRLVYPMEKEAMRFANLLGNKFFSMAFTWILNQRFKDTLCGTKVLYRTDYERIKKDRGYFGELDPFGDFDLIFGAVKQNLKIIEIPIRYRERTYNTTNIKRFRHGWLLLKMTARAYLKIKAV
ncbi:MAG: glycosyltransferase [Desulfosudaceae bacterium]